MEAFRLDIRILVALFGLTNIPVVAQLTSGNITRAVYDPGGATVPNATVVVRNIGTGVKNSTTSTSAGEYRFENLPVGTYTITVSAPGVVKA